MSDITPEMLAMGIDEVNNHLGGEYPFSGQHPFAEQIAIAVYRAMRVGAETQAIPSPDGSVSVGVPR